ncbi:MAG: hypothetical protein ACQEP9_06760 [Bacillota bacterium]
MKRTIILALIFSLVIVSCYNLKVASSSETKIRIKFPTNLNREVKLNINPQESKTEFIRLQIKNPQQKKLVVSLDATIDGELDLNDAIKYRIQDNRNKKTSWSNINSRAKVRENPFEITNNYSGWVKIKFRGLEEWWKLKAGSYQGQLRVRVHEKDRQN